MLNFFPLSKADGKETKGLNTLFRNTKVANKRTKIIITKNWECFEVNPHLSLWNTIVLI